MPARLIESLATTDPLADLFSDESVLQAMLDFEAALARAEALAGVIPQAAAEAIAAAAAKAGAFDVSALAHDSMRAGTPGIPLAKALTQRVRASNPDAARFVHWGATSQDVADTALVLLLKRARPLLEADLTRLQQALRHLAEQHGKTLMLGRTLLQAAPPVTFGLKAAGWRGAIVRGHARLAAAFEEALVVQFGGASGTLASLGEKGPAVGRALAKELGLGYPDAPWHTQRDRLAALVCACGILTGSLGKMARDVSLLMQGEVAEAAEPGEDGRGGSSTMPQKRNPIACVLTLAAATRVPGLVSGFLSSMVQEHERGVGGWQAEWPTVAGVIQATGLAVASMAEVAGGLTVDEARMRANIQSTQGAIFAEKAMLLLGEHFGHDAAHQLLEKATRNSRAQGRRLAEVLAEMPEVNNHIAPAALQQLEAPEQYLGAAEEFRAGLLGKQNTSE
ncbi:MAG: 3-carboxy-cis,cis-muconate cycloisomerase [Acidobacteriia bacterium]|nr:3-carboxy-cis,cis-muconate cycloisomerase [Terriglobia bacterium]